MNTISKAIVAMAMVVSTAASAKMTLDTETGDYSWRVNGQPVSAIEAFKAAQSSDAEIERCRSKKAGKKKLYAEGGGELKAAVECTVVELKITKRGTTKWKTK